MISQERIIESLHENKCTKCGRNYMSATRQESIGKDGVEVNYYVGCNWCSNRWEITKSTFENNVRIMDTRSYKDEHGY